ncbi:Nucleotidyl transferase AbiEii toxin, Type IV TA system [uncultured archaeon]|nr:Nucleotidyl transferase AbiEii toxin, Type IV TA system [uncultured archaeon]
MDKERLKEFIAFLKNKTAIKSEELLEKDFYISVLLQKIGTGEYAFKGGTCLSKVYLNYYRISEDVDLTYIDQNAFKGKSTKQIKKICSEKITIFGKLLEDIAKEYDFDFRLEKSNKRYVELGSNNKLATFKIWYRSAFTDTESFIKIQINFLEIIKYPIIEKAILPIINVSAFSETEHTYFSDFMGVYKPLKWHVYDLHEIASEKVRALLTRKGVKARDIVDLYFLEKKHKINIYALKDACVEKVNFAIRSYDKYKKSFLARDSFEKGILLEDVSHLMLTELDKKDFEAFTQKLFAFLEEVKAEIST